MFPVVLKITTMVSLAIAAMMREDDFMSCSTYAAATQIATAS